MTGYISVPTTDAMSTAPVPIKRQRCSTGPPGQGTIQIKNTTSGEKVYLYNTLWINAHWLWCAWCTWNFDWRSKNNFLPIPHSKILNPPMIYYFPCLVQISPWRRNFNDWVHFSSNNRCHEHCSSTNKTTTMFYRASRTRNYSDKEYYIRLESLS